MGLWLYRFSERIRVNWSDDTLSHICTQLIKEVEVTPSKYVEQAQVGAARRSLEQAGSSLHDIPSAACRGWLSPSHSEFDEEFFILRSWIDHVTRLR